MILKVKVVCLFLLQETNSHVLQMQHAYAANRRAANPLQVIYSSCSYNLHTKQNVGR